MHTNLPGLPVAAAAAVVMTFMSVFRAIERTSCPADVGGNVGWGCVALFCGWVAFHLIKIGIYG